jgi:hypothetical protein
MRIVDLPYVGRRIPLGKEHQATPEVKVSSWQSR